MPRRIRAEPPPEPRPRRDTLRESLMLRTKVRCGTCSLSAGGSAQERHDVVEHLVAVGLVEHLVARPGIDLLLETRALDRLDRRPGVEERHQGVVGAEDPKRRQFAEGAADEDS